MASISAVTGGYTVSVSYGPMTAAGRDLSSAASRYFESLEAARAAMDSIKADMVGAGGTWLTTRDVEHLPSATARAECFFNESPRPCGKSLLSRVKAALVSVRDIVMNWFARLLGRAVPMTPAADAPKVACNREDVSRAQGVVREAVGDFPRAVSRQERSYSLPAQLSRMPENMHSDDGLEWDSTYDYLPLTSDREATFNHWVDGPQGLEAEYRVGLDDKNFEGFERPVFNGGRGSV